MVTVSVLVPMVITTGTSLPAPTPVGMVTLS